MKKVLYIVSTLKKSGPIIMLYDLINFLDKNQFKVYILTLSKEEKNSIKSLFEQQQVSIISLNYSRLEYFLYKKKIINFILNQLKPDIIHSHGIRADILASSLKCSTISTIHNFFFDDYPMKFGLLKGYIMAYSHLGSIKKIKHPIACSYSIQKKLLQSFKLQTLVVNNGVNIEVFNKVENKDIFRELLKLPLNKKIFVFTGSLNRRKNPLFLINCFLKLINKNFFLVIIGDGELKKECLKIADKNENIRIEGFRPNTIDYLHAADYYISASLSEGLPIAVIEAMSCGLPVCLSNIEPHKELLNHNPVAGHLFNLTEIELEIAINNLVAFDYQKSSTSAREIVVNFYSASKMSKCYQEIYSNCF